MATRVVGTRGRARAALALGVTMALLAPGRARAQAPAELPRVTGSVELTLVNVDVVVTGKDGRPVEGLSAADFEVLHGKKLVAVTNFREEKPDAGVPPADAGASVPGIPPEGGTPRVPAAAPAQDEPRVRRHVVLFIDHLALPDPREREDVFGSLKAILKRTLQPGDEAMIVAWRGGVQSVFPFSGDLDVLDERIDVVAGAAIRLGRETLSEIERLAADDASYAWAESGDSRLSRDLNAQQAYAEIKGKVTALNGLIAAMAGMEGRKALVIASRSLSRRAGAEYGRGIDARPLVESIAEKANAAGVTIHALYAAAWQGEGPNVETSRYVEPRLVGRSGLTLGQEAWNNEMATLDLLAQRTGGVVIPNTMEAPVFADRVASDLTHWYSLGYPVPDGAGRSAGISVRVKRPGATVRTRRSVTDRSPVTVMEDRVLASLFRRDEYARLPIAVASSPAAKEKKDRFRTALVVRVPARHLVLVPTQAGARGAVSIFTVTAGAGGEFSDVKRERHEIELPAESARPDSTVVLSYETEVVTSDPGARISIGVWDETGGNAGFRLIRPVTR